MRVLVIPPGRVPLGYTHMRGQKTVPIGFLPAVLAYAASGDDPIGTIFILTPSEQTDPCLLYTRHG